MNPIRFRIARLMGLVLVVAVGGAALRAADDWWADAAFSATLLTLAAALIAAFVRRGPSRAGWVGASVVGRGYLAMSTWPPLSREFEPRMLSSGAIDVAYPLIHPEGGSGPPKSMFETTSRGFLKATGRFPQTTEKSRTIGHSLVALLMAATGGIFGAWIGSESCREG